jgi:GR25 family glycosyltransferase involved in LPS biosynthesis
VARLFNFQNPAVFVIDENRFFKGKDAKLLKEKYAFASNKEFARYRSSVNQKFIQGLENDVFSADIFEEFEGKPLPALYKSEFEAVYLMHYKKSPDRVTEMKERLLDAGFIWVYLIYQYDKDDLSTSDIDCWFSKSAQVYLKYSIGVISLYIKHYFAYYHIVRSNYRSGMILEDDAWFLNNSLLYKMYEEKLPKSYNFFFSGSCCDLNSQKFDPSREKFGVYREKSSRCTHAYYVSKFGASLMLRFFQTSCPIDHHINQIQKIFPPFEIYWAEPPLVIQKNNGSILYSSSPSDEVIPSFFDICYNSSDPLYKTDFLFPSFWENN